MVGVLNHLKLPISQGLVRLPALDNRCAHWARITWRIHPARSNEWSPMETGGAKRAKVLIVTRRTENAYNGVDVANS